MSRHVRVSLLVVAWVLVAGDRPARAFEFFDGRLQIHGSFEEQIRTLARDMSPQDNFDLAQWYNVLSLETEYTATDSGWGPFDMLSFFGRVEARYDCIWTRACGMFPSVDAWGNRAEHEPLRMLDARTSGYQGSVFVGDQHAYAEQQLAPEPDPRTGLDVATVIPANPHHPLSFGQLHRIDGLFEVAGPDQIYGTRDDPAAFAFRKILDRCSFGSRAFAGGDDGHGVQILGPIEPECRMHPLGRLAYDPNPFSSIDLNPVLFGPDGVPFTADDVVDPPVGSGELPFRPAPLRSNTAHVDHNQAQGLYYPSPALRRGVDQHLFNSYDQDFSQSELAWNHGASQQDEYELKELFADMEFFDSRLWIRAGKQNIVWGKTELFRTTDQFNPQDLALATLPDLVEARIPLWSVRGVYSFYEVGPFQDVRLELAANLDDFEPADIGRCGEPFTVFAACNKTTALFFHGVAGFGIAGEDRPPNPLSSLSGLNYGARLEFRVGRFSMQLSDFYGYDYFPYADRLFDYGRAVDPDSGRPVRAGGSGRCATGTEPGCLGRAPFSNIAPDGSTLSLDPAQQKDVLDNTTVNMQLFAMICSTSIGFNAVDPTACGQTVFNSLSNALSRSPVPRNWDAATNNGAKPPRGSPDGSGVPVVSALLANGLAGNRPAASVLRTLARDTTGASPRFPLVRLNLDPCDSYQSGHCGDSAYPDYGPHAFFAGDQTLNEVLTDEQEALLGCGAFYGTDCEADGFDLANAEASVLMQSFVGAPGKYSSPFGWTQVNGRPQPGTTGFAGGPVGTRFVAGKGVVVLPGARGPSDRGFDPAQDGCTGPGDGALCAAAHVLAIPATAPDGGALRDGGYGPSTGQVFASEMAALSFNFQVLTAALSSVPDADGNLLPDGPPKLGEFDAAHPFSTATGQCSWAQPQFCAVIVSLFNIIGQQRNDVRAAGNGDFGRTDFLWHSGAEAVLRYEKRNVLGFSTDFAEDVTKSNWSIESAWIEGQRFTDANAQDGISESDTFNLTVSIDRPTFINFLNQQRTFFINTQIFFQYVPGYSRGFSTNGPWNLLGTLTVNTGYFRDRLQPAVTFVYDQQSGSGGILPKIAYRFSSNFSVTLGANFFMGRFEQRASPLAPISSVDNQVGQDAYHQGVENALAVVRDRDELYLRLRYTW